MPFKDDMIGKWGAKAFNHGYTAVPNLLFRYIAHLGNNKLKTGEQAVLFHLLLSYYRAGERVRPSYGSISDSVGITTRQVARNLKQLEEKGLIEITPDPDNARSTNLYTFNGLKSALEEFAKATNRENKSEDYRRGVRVTRKVIQSRAALRF